MEKPQNFANHVRFHPPFHFFILPVMGINLILAIVLLIRQPAFASAWFLVLSVALLLAVFQIRAYAAKVQDRVIRLEERMRLSAVLQEPLRSRVGELTLSQLIGLRFAADEELSGLVERALAEKLSTTDIKKAIVNWRPDYLRV